MPMTSRGPDPRSLGGGLKAWSIAQRAGVGPSHPRPTRWGSAILLSSLVGRVVAIAVPLSMLEYRWGDAIIRSFCTNS